MKRRKVDWTSASIARQGITSEWGLQIDGKKQSMKESRIINLKPAVIIRRER